MRKAQTVETGISSYPDLESSTAIARIQWAKNTYGDSLLMSTSFGIQSAVLLHLVTQQIPNIKVIFIDTGYLFPETYALAEELTKRLDLNLLTYRATLTSKEQEEQYGQ